MRKIQQLAMQCKSQLILP